MYAEERITCTSCGALSSIYYSETDDKPIAMVKEIGCQNCTFDVILHEAGANWSDYKMYESNKLFIDDRKIRVLTFVRNEDIFPFNFHFNMWSESETLIYNKFSTCEECGGFSEHCSGICAFPKFAQL
jgi:hypothetical protein